MTYNVFSGTLNPTQSSRTPRRSWNAMGSSYLPMASASQPPSSEPMMPPGMKSAVVSDHSIVSDSGDTSPP